jgi:ribosomal protein S18 acetylase RimI-like enzyme
MYQIRKAVPGEETAVFALYRSLVGTPGCTWSFKYPDEEDVQRDLDGGNLYVVCDGDTIVAAAAAFPDEEFTELHCWSAGKTPCEAARLGVRSDYQGQGIAGMLLSAIETEMREKGFDAVRLLVGQQNDKAQRAYQKLGYVNVGETRMFAIDWFCYEKCLYR